MTTPNQILQNAVKTFLTPYFRNVFKNIYIKSCFDANNAEIKTENGAKTAYTEYMKGIRYCVENNVACQNSINVVEIIEESKKFCSEDIIRSLFKLIICDVFASCMEIPENQISVDKFIRRIMMISCDFLQSNFEYFDQKNYKLIDELVQSAIEHAMYRSLDLSFLTSAYLTSTLSKKSENKLQDDLNSIKQHQKNMEIDIKNIPIQNIPVQAPQQIQLIPYKKEDNSTSTSSSSNSSSSSSSASSEKKKKKHKKSSVKSSSSSSSDSSSSKESDSKESEKDSSPKEKQESSVHEQISKLIFENSKSNDAYNFLSENSTEPQNTEVLNNELLAVEGKMKELEKLKQDFENQQKKNEDEYGLLKNKLESKKKDVTLPLIQYGDATIGGDVKSLNQPANSYKEKIYESFDA